jgi:citrate synthase
MISFWRDEPLSEKEWQLLNELHSAHAISTYRNNASTLAVANSAGASGSYLQSIASALMTLGGMHGPLLQAYDFLNGKTFNGIQPGWGNSFVKGEPDATWEKVDLLLKENWADIYSIISNKTKEFHDSGKKIYPNPSIYTAAVAHALSLPRDVIAILFITSRIEAWSDIYLKNRKEF